VTLDDPQRIAGEALTIIVGWSIFQGTKPASIGEFLGRAVCRDRPFG
jgi:hypothetical protein